MIMKRIIIVTVLLLCSCTNITQDDFSYEVLRRTTISSEYGPIFVTLIFQNDFQLAISEEEIAHIILSSIEEYENRFGAISEEKYSSLQNWTIYVVREDSSLWQEICWDAPNDLPSVDACSGTEGYSLFLFQEASNQIAIRLGVYERGCSDTGVYIHEVMHHLLWNLTGDDDYTHSNHEIWERFLGGNPNNLIETLATATEGC